MTDAPKRIWANVNPYGGGFLGLATSAPNPIYSQVEYIRADLAPTAAQVMANEKVRALVEALRFYADKSNYKTHWKDSGGGYFNEDFIPVVVEGGNTARAILRDLEAAQIGKVE